MLDDVGRLKTCKMLQLLYPEEGICDPSRGSSSCKSLYPEDPAALQDSAWRTSRHVELLVVRVRNDKKCDLDMPRILV